MGEYRCVNFYELCRLCTASQGKKIHIFSEEGKQKQLQAKISKGLLINVDENDKLPKILCVSCVQQVETIYDYKNNCVQAQNLLEGCLTSTKMRNGSQVYIKSGAPTLPKVTSEAPPLTPSFTITATPKMTNLPTTQVTPTNVSSDFLSSIIQAVGIQTNEEQNEPVIQQQQQSMPQYTLTIDGQTLKASPIQYKLTETTPGAATFNLQPSTSGNNESGDLTGSISVDEFLKLKNTPKTPRKVQPLSIDLSGMTNATKKAKVEMDKKPKINFVLSTPTKQQPQTIPMTIPAQMTNNQPKTISLQQLLQGQANKNQTVVPLMIKSDGTIEASNQFLSQLMTNNEMTPPRPQPQPQPQYNPQQPPVAYVQLKIQQSPDGHPTVQLMPQQPQTVQLSTQAFQNLNIQQQIQAQLAAQAAAQQQLQNQVNQQQQQQQQQTQFQLTPQQLQTVFNQVQVQQQQQQQPTTISIAPSQQAHIIPQQIQAPPQQQQVSVDTQVSQSDITMEQEEKKPVIQVKRQTAKKTKQAELQNQNKTSQKVVNQPQIQQQQPQQQQQTQSIEISIPQSQTQTQIQLKNESNNNSDGGADDGQPTIESIMAQQQMQLITSIKHEGNDPPQTLTTCEVCKKVFKRKEHLMQHLKSHVGLRPFKCEESGCNKSFSRKEHLLRHIVSHTGKKTHIIPQQIQAPPQQQQVSVDTQVSQSDITMEQEEKKPVIQVKRQTAKKTKQAEPQNQNKTSQKVVSQPQIQQQQPPQQQQTQSIEISIPQSQTQTQIQLKNESNNNSDGGADDGQPTIESIMAQQQMQLITSIKHEGNDPPQTLTTCEVCKKVFKRKEHLMQHLKSHVGLRPFKCEESGCNKSFSRKEHLLRHIVSHTGKKSFSCDLCHKFFSRKDNLNKHRRTHSDTGGENVKVKKEKGSPGDNSETNPLVTKIKSRKQVKVKQEAVTESEQVTQQQEQQQQQTLLPQPTYQSIKIQPQPEYQISQGQPIQIQMTSAAGATNTVQTIGQIAYTTNQTTTQASKTTYIKAVTSSDGNTLYTIPLNMQQSNFITTNAQGELQLGGFKMENRPNFKKNQKSFIDLISIRTESYTSMEKLFLYTIHV
uniref:CSON006727 protein n=1 Tax=Culicoides sonorensis TaxID=179676 RepID=A0A336MTU4_CULSO